MSFLKDDLNVAVAGALVVLFSVLQYVQFQRRSISKVPSIGPSGFFSSWYGAWRYLFNAQALLKEGHKKYNVFKIPQMGSWMVLVSTPELIEDIRKAPSDKLSFLEATNDLLAIPWTLGDPIHHNPYHIPIIRGQLTRNLSPLFDDIKDEIEHAWDDVIPAKEDEWVRMPALDSVMRIVGRTSNRIFVGLPLCRDPDYLKLNVKFTMDVVFTGAIINMFPKFLRPIVGNMLTIVPNSVKRGVEHLRPLIEHRQKMIDENGPDYTGKPNDLLSWLMDEAEGEERSVRALTMRILTINFAAIHTSSMSFTHALFYLAAEPEKYLWPMRQEVRAIIEEHGWTKVAMTKMRKVDSFLREAQRHRGIGALSGGRKAMVDFTFSDGTVVPKGATVAIAANAIHHDDANYDNAEEFEGFRFADLREEEGEGTKHQMVNAGPTYLTFGVGKYTCPGRFFAANELKAMMAYLVMNYDVKAETPGVRPPDREFGSAFAPNSKAGVLLKKVKN